MTLNAVPVIEIPDMTVREDAGLVEIPIRRVRGDLGLPSFIVVSSQDTQNPTGNAIGIYDSDCKMGLDGVGSIFIIRNTHNKLYHNVSALFNSW